MPFDIVLVLMHRFHEVFVTSISAGEDPSLAVNRRIITVPNRYTMTNIRLRPVRQPQDMLLLQHIYATSRDYEMDRIKFPEPFLTRFLTDQFLLQHRQYIGMQDVRLSIVETIKGEPLGRFYIRHMPFPEIRVMDIALLPVHRGRGLGRLLFGQTMEEARRRCCRVSLHVEKHNPARTFYEKLEFCCIGGDDVYDFMVWPVVETGTGNKI